jgi:hypothetical protein
MLLVIDFLNLEISNAFAIIIVLCLKRVRGSLALYCLAITASDDCESWQGYLAHDWPIRY